MCSQQIQQFFETGRGESNEILIDKRIKTKVKKNDTFTKVVWVSLRRNLKIKKMVEYLAVLVFGG